MRPKMVHKLHQKPQLQPVLKLDAQNKNNPLCTITESVDTIIVPAEIFLRLLKVTLFLKIYYALLS